MQKSDSVKVAVIGGSGVYNLDTVDVVAEHNIETPFGFPSDSIKELKFKDRSKQLGSSSHFYFLARHGKGHTISPSEINYRANIFALKKIGVKYVLSVSAVGSLQEEFAPTSFVLPDQFIDWTKGKRERTFFGHGMVGHVSNAEPIGKNLQMKIAEVCQKHKIPVHVGGSYVCIEGPQFSTKAESSIYRSFGASVIGMTNVPEVFLAKEAGLCYATIAMVTDYDCWKDQHCQVEEIMQVMKTNYSTVQILLQNLIPQLVANPVEYIPENKFAVVTHEDKLNSFHREILDVILK